ncbi:hypothetical protein BEWA_015660 [Theileria equi strain WA]|uniref:Uncharacterized protein n=1 Tax=Theileria equi strain WA TaxID=1537102 RepID=L1LCM8_THEEQ|nr:hypothetical protein BEWA_015660 [Theileria equi strain WA]EKX73005.1 hypothetical protein BEWA_015660 [Theileria equi strain WA]|eukprot:XP_004832457.1 hypothetical protein BEWA_015660 [Theileria equi strain WA]
MSDRWLQLNLKNKCDNNACSCSGNKPGGLDSKRETRIESITGFVQYTHKYKEGFKLLPNLGDGERLELQQNHQEIKEVTEVSVYYWDKDKDCNTPLLLRIIKNGETHSPIYYKRYDENEEEGNPDPKVWKLYNNSNSTSLQDLLDDRNLGRNNVFPLYLDQPTKHFESTSNIAKSINVQLAGSPSRLPGSDYIVAEYKLNGQGETRFSRVMLDKDKVNGIEIPADAITNIRLYSSSINDSKVPVMVEFVGPNGGNSKWFHTQGANGTQWGEDAGSSGFYTGKGNLLSQLTEQFTKRLDGFVCEHHNGVTIDLSHGVSTGNERQYCCEEHGGKKGGKVSVKTENIALNTAPGNFITVYKHHVEEGHKIADIKFYQDDNDSKRRRIWSNKLRLPIPGPVDIYTFYSGNNPELIYVYGAGGKSPVKGWFRRDSSGYGATWKRTYKKLRGIRKDEIDRKQLNCQQWTALAEVLKKRGTDLPGCTPETAQPSTVARAEDPAGELGLEPEDEEEDGSGDEQSSDDSDSARVNSAPGKDGPKPDVAGESGANAGGGGASRSSDDGTTTSETTTPTSSATNAVHSAAISSTASGVSTPQPPEKLFAETTLGLGVIVSSVFGGSGLTGFLGYKGYSLYKNFKGDPWVRQI